MYHDMKSELRDYDLAELQEVKEFASAVAWDFTFSQRYCYGAVRK